jgi:histidinol-phosphatase (PHP family)
MNYLVDYHIHTNNSFDSKVKMIDYCQRAVELGLKEVVFTEHFDLNPFDKGLGHFNFSKYSQEIEECREKFRKKLSIKKGLELGEPHLYQKQHSDFLKDKDFDFFLGSIHYVGNQVLHRTYNDEEDRDVYFRYFNEVLETAKNGDFHVLGHLDVLKRYVPRHFQKFMARDYEEIIREILKNVINNSKGIEINTSGYRQGLGEPLPTIDILKWYRELGGEIITIGSDAHHLQQLGQDLDKGIQIARELGFRGIWTFEKGKPQLISFK